MSRYKLLRHDLRAGLLRRRYLCVPLLFLVSCFLCELKLPEGLRAGWTELLLFCFKGMPPPQQLTGFLLPAAWFAITAGSLLLQLDYLLDDLTQAGLQVIVRSGSRWRWYLSKCMWNLVSCGVIVVLGLVTALLWSLIGGGGLGAMDPLVARYALELWAVEALPVGQVLWIGAVLPWLTIGALSQLQMTLCLYVRPILAFLSAAALLVSSLLIASLWLPGNGAQTVRSSMLGGSLDPVWMTVVCVVLLVGAALAGGARFRRMDLMRYEG